MNILPHGLLGKKATRVLRVLLVHREKAWRVTELAVAAQVSPAYAVKLTRILEREGYLRKDGFEHRAANPGGLLDRWAQAHHFGEKEAFHRFVVGGDPTVVDRQLAEVAGKLKLRYALTLFAAARHRAPFVRYPATHVYVEGDPAPLARALDARAISEQGNLLLVTPRDAGVFFGTHDAGGLRLVSDIQLYLDLFNFEARGREQAEFVLEKLLPDLLRPDLPESKAAFGEALRLRDEADTAYGRREYVQAVKLYEDLAKRLSAFPGGDAIQELDRARLLLWMALVHAACETGDRSYLDRAREIFVTASEVEGLRREVGYSPALTALAILAYYAALYLASTEPAERGTYRKKAEAHCAILRSPYTEGAKEVAGAAEAIWVRIADPSKGGNPWAPWQLEYQTINGRPIISGPRLDGLQRSHPKLVLRRHKNGRIHMIRLDRRYRVSMDDPGRDTYFLDPVEPSDVDIRIYYETKSTGGGERHEYDLILSLTNRTMTAIKDYRVEVDLPVEIFPPAAAAPRHETHHTLVRTASDVGQPLFNGKEVEVLRMPYVFTHETRRLVDGVFSRRDFAVRVRLYGDRISPVADECSMRELNNF